MTTALRPIQASRLGCGSLGAPGDDRCAWGPVVISLVAAGALLRFVALDHQSLWLDEFLAFLIGQGDPGELLERTRAIAGQSPFYYVVVHFWSVLFGREDAVVVRALSATFGVVSLAQLYLFARRFAGESQARVALAILTLSPLHLYFSQEARMYPLLLVLVLAIVHLCLSAVRAPAARGLLRMAAIAALTAAALYTHYYALLFVAALDVFLVLTWRRSGAVIPRIALAQLVGAIAYLPWIPALLQAADSGGNAFIRFVGLKGLYAAYTFALGYSSVVLDATTKDAIPQQFLAAWPRVILGAVAFGALVLQGVRGLWRADRDLLLLLALLLGLPVAIATLVSFRMPIISERYFSPALPFFALLLGYGIVAARGVARWAPLAIAGLLVAHSLSHYWFDPRFGNHDWRAATQWVSAHRSRGEVLLFHPAFIEPCFRFYARDVGAGQGIDASEEVAALASGGTYALVVSHARPELTAILEALDRRFERVEEVWLPRGEGIRVLRYAPRRADDAAAGKSGQR